MTNSANASSVQETLTQEFDSLDTYFDAIFATLHGGHMPDITGLDKRIAQLCSLVKNAPRDTQEDSLAKLDGLLKKLDDCAEKMTDLHTSLYKK